MSAQPAPPSTCRYCGRAVRIQPATVRRWDHATREYRQEPNPLVGMYDRGGAVRMFSIDPRGYFCKMACAVKYAVRAVKQTERT